MCCLYLGQLLAIHSGWRISGTEVASLLKPADQRLIRGLYTHTHTHTCTHTHTHTYTHTQTLSKHTLILTHSTQQTHTLKRLKQTHSLILSHSTQAGHKLMKIGIQPGQEIEMVTMVIECCSQVCVCACARVCVCVSMRDMFTVLFHLHLPTNVRAHACMRCVSVCVSGFVLSTTVSPLEDSTLLKHVAYNKNSATCSTKTVLV
jgi:hypothetical protein